MARQRVLETDIEVTHEAQHYPAQRFLFWLDRWNDEWWIQEWHRRHPEGET